ncbi:hypothetical protein C1H76_9419 [Elsinoe australis]|uniref:Uncharacterized protein n=1 Tax=Elsinoe australis TaxID=40998 RepID=A0A4U7ALK5_9PEZI|nr:hypothetical protein C1H76_9419 [Elsinoe australis]
MKIAQLLCHPPETRYAQDREQLQPLVLYMSTTHTSQRPQDTQEQTWSTQQEHDSYGYPTPESITGTSSAGETPQKNISSPSFIKMETSYDEPMRITPKHDAKNTLRQRHNRERRRDILTRLDQILAVTGCTVWEKQRGVSAKSGAQGRGYTEDDILVMAANRADLLNRILPFVDLSSDEVRAALGGYDGMALELQEKLGGPRPNKTDLLNRILTLVDPSSDEVRAALSGYDGMALELQEKLGGLRPDCRMVYCRYT